MAVENNIPAINVASDFVKLNFGICWQKKG